MNIHPSVLEWFLWLEKCLATGVVNVLYLKNMNLESVSDSISGLSYILYIEAVTFQAINKIVALTAAIHHLKIFFFNVEVLICPNLKILLQYLQACGVIL